MNLCIDFFSVVPLSRLGLVFILEITNRISHGQFGLWAGGDSDVVDRLAHGVSLKVLEQIHTVFKIDQELEEFFRNCFSFAAPLVSPAMPLKDAIGLAEFLIKTAIDHKLFVYDDKTIGGPINIAALTKYEGFNWIKRNDPLVKDVIFIDEAPK